MGEVLKKFGRYFLLDQIAQGGMAEIYRARFATIDNAGRLLVIKRIQSGFGANAEFISMFKSEIKVTMGFNHPNIVQVYDFGEEQSQPYIAMELVDGKNLRQFIQRFNEHKTTFPVELAAYIIEQAASGLHYAHSFRDKITGESLNIVHRDISPQNILISFEGTVKVIDFGIAKATTNSEATRAGVIKGKPSYLSPEQITGEQLDGRCDIFALGTVLWELLTGKKLFQGENDLAVLKLIESCSTYVKPPSVLNPQVPKELDYIVLKALAKHRDKRYQTADELQRALHKFIYSFNPDFNPADLSYLAKDLFKAEIVEDRKLIQRLNERVEQLLQADQKAQEQVAMASKSSSSAKEEDTTTIVEMKSKGTGSNEYGSLQKPRMLEIENEFGGKRVSTGPAQLPGTRSSRSRTSTPRQSASSRFSGISRGSWNFREKVKWAAGAAAAALVVAALGPKIGIPMPGFVEQIRSKLSFSTSPSVVVNVNAADVSIYVNGALVGNQLPATLDGLPVEVPVKIEVDGREGRFSREVMLAQGEQRTFEVNFTDRVPSSIFPRQDMVVLKLNILPLGGGDQTEVVVNGQKLDPRAPVISVGVNSHIELTVDRPGFRGVKKDFTIQANQVGRSKEYEMKVELEPIRFGLLTIRTTPSAEAHLIVNGKPWVRKTPIEDEKIPAGTYNIRLVNEALGMGKNVTVGIQEGKRVTIDERLGFKK